MIVVVEKGTRLVISYPSIGQRHLVKISMRKI